MAGSPTPEKSTARDRSRKPLARIYRLTQFPPCSPSSLHRNWTGSAPNPRTVAPSWAYFIDAPGDDTITPEPTAL